MRTKGKVAARKCPVAFESQRSLSNVNLNPQVRLTRLTEQQLQGLSFPKSTKTQPSKSKSTETQPSESKSTETQSYNKSNSIETKTKSKSKSSSQAEPLSSTQQQQGSSVLSVPGPSGQVINVHLHVSKDGLSTAGDDGQPLQLPPSLLAEISRALSTQGISTKQQKDPEKNQSENTSQAGTKEGSSLPTASTVITSTQLSRGQHETERAEEDHESDDRVLTIHDEHDDANDDDDFEVMTDYDSDTLPEQKQSEKQSGGLTTTQDSKVTSAVSNAAATQDPKVTGGFSNAAATQDSKVTGVFSNAASMQDSNLTPLSPKLPSTHSSGGQYGTQRSRQDGAAGGANRSFSTPGSALVKQKQPRKQPGSFSYAGAKQTSGSRQAVKKVQKKKQLKDVSPCVINTNVMMRLDKLKNTQGMKSLSHLVSQLLQCHENATSKKGGKSEKPRCLKCRSNLDLEIYCADCGEGVEDLNQQPSGSHATGGEDSIALQMPVTVINPVIPTAPSTLSSGGGSGNKGVKPTAHGVRPGKGNATALHAGQKKKVTSPVKVLGHQVDTANDDDDFDDDGGEGRVKVTCSEYVANFLSIQQMTFPEDVDVICPSWHEEYGAIPEEELKPAEKKRGKKRRNKMPCDVRKRTNEERFMEAQAARKRKQEKEKERQSALEEKGSDKVQKSSQGENSGTDYVQSDDDTHENCPQPNDNDEDFPDRAPSPSLSDIDTENEHIEVKSLRHRAVKYKCPNFQKKGPGKAKVIVLKKEDGRDPIDPSILTGVVEKIISGALEKSTDSNTGGRTGVRESTDSCTAVSSLMPSGFSDKTSVDGKNSSVIYQNDSAITVQTRVDNERSEKETAAESDDPAPQDNQDSKETSTEKPIIINLIPTTVPGSAPKARTGRPRKRDKSLKRNWFQPYKPETLQKLAEQERRNAEYRAKREAKLEAMKVQEDPNASPDENVEDSNKWIREPVAFDPIYLEQLPEKIQTRHMIKKAMGEPEERVSYNSLLGEREGPPKRKKRKRRKHIHNPETEDDYDGTSIVCVEEDADLVNFRGKFMDEAGRYHDCEVMEEYETASLLAEPVSGTTRHALQQLLERPLRNVTVSTTKEQRQMVRLRKRLQREEDRRQSGRKPYVRRNDFHSNLRGLERHKAYYKWVRGKPYECGECGEKFCFLKELEKHLIQTMTDSRYRFKCIHCEALLMNDNDMRNHCRTHLKDMPHKCSKCPAKFVTSFALQYHSYNHDNKVKELCPHCGKGFRFGSQLRDHLKKHSEDRPFTCAHCGRSFKNKNNLIFHERIHTGERPYKCHVCPADFRTIDGLRVHKMIHTGERPYPCPHCDFRDRSKGGLQRHMGRMHKNAAVTSVSSTVPLNQFSTVEVDYIVYE